MLQQSSSNGVLFPRGQEVRHGGGFLSQRRAAALPVLALLCSSIVPVLL